MALLSLSSPLAPHQDGRLEAFWRAIGARYVVPLPSAVRPHERTRRIEHRKLGKTPNESLKTRHDGFSPDTQLPLRRELFRLLAIKDGQRGVVLSKRDPADLGQSCR